MIFEFHITIMNSYECWINLFKYDEYIYQGIKMVNPKYDQ